MKTLLLTILKVTGLALLVLALVYTLWEPVLPSRVLIQGMAKRIDPKGVPEGEQRVVRFALAGKGGGTYNFVVRNDGVDVVEGETDQVDLILFMKARNFNDLIFSLASGEANANTFLRLMISKVMRTAGDMDVLKLIFQKPDANG